MKSLKNYKGNAELLPILTEIAENEDEYRDLLGDDYIHFSYTLRGVMQSIEFYAEDDFELRERYIHENFAGVYKDYEIDKCFGMFGGAHTLLDGTMGSETNLASFIKNTLDLDVLSIMTDYNACEYMGSKDGKAYPVTYTYSGKLSDMMAELTPGSFALYRLDAEGTPFGEDGLGFTQSFQYYLTVKNSPAATPYKPLP